MSVSAQQTSRHIDVLLDAVYGAETAHRVRPELDRVLRQHGMHANTAVRWDERDAWLITYPDQFQSDGTAPLEVLRTFYLRHLAATLNGVHVLPFFPWSSDDGYSITDYEAVDPAYGTWDDIERLATSTRLMVDAVVNHMSAQSRWFDAWQTGAPEFTRFFRVSEPDRDLSQVVRARQHPLLTRFETARGPEWVWTTFSADQVDLDFSNPAVLLRIIEVLLGYARHGAAAVRLDAICFLWKDETTPSIHLEQTHQIVQLFRACLDVTYPHVVLVSETNVPHQENVSYLGRPGEAEAQVVYQFSLPPLVLHTFTSGDATALSEWLRNSAATPPGTTFFNFLASHDGIGLRPLEGILSPEAVNQLADLAEAAGGMVSRRSLADGTSSPYELNATWYELIRGTTTGADALQRHLASHAIMLALRGIPGIYVHSLFASSNDLGGATRTGMARSINRHKFTDVAALERALADPESCTALAMSQIQAMVAFRRSIPAFHPDAAQSIVDVAPELFAVERMAADGSQARVLINVSGKEQTVSLPAHRRTLSAAATVSDGHAELGPWGYVWIAG